MGLCLEILTSGCWFSRPSSLPSLADGLFGQCQVGSVQDRPYFQVTSPVLQRLQDVLRHLMAQGEGGSAGEVAATLQGSGKNFLVALGLSEVLLAQGPRWAEEGDPGRSGVKPRPWDTGSEYQESIPCTRSIVPRLPPCLTASSRGRALVAGWHHPVCDLSGDGAHPPPPPAPLAGAGGQGQVGQHQQSSVEQ